MTEAEWLSSTNTFAMLAHLGESTGWRKRQLYCLAVWGGVRHWLDEDEHDYFHEGLARLAQGADIDWADQDGDRYEDLDEACRYVDGGLINRFCDRLVTGDGELHDAFQTNTEARLTSWDDQGCVESGVSFAVTSEALYRGAVPSLVAENITITAVEVASRIATNAIAHGAMPMSHWWDHHRRLADLVREVFGNPFRPSKVDPGWLAWGDGIVAKLARAIDEDHDFSRLPILGDALEDAGCDDAAFLDHLRSPGLHVRGCWAVDLILSKDR